MKEAEVIEIDLKELMYVLLSKLHIIILSMVLGGLIAFFLSAVVMDEKFEAVTSIYVLNKQDSNVVTYTDLQTGTQLTKDYAELVTCRSVMDQVIAQLRLAENYEDMSDITYEQLAQMVTVSNATDTRIISISVKDTQPARAQDIANAIREAAAIHITSVMDIEAVNVVDYAEMPLEAVEPRVLYNSCIGAILGIALAMAVIVCIHLLDDTIKSPDDIERYLGISVLGSIPLDNKLFKESKKPIYNKEQ